MKFTPPFITFKEHCTMSLWTAVFKKRKDTFQQSRIQVLGHTQGHVYRGEDQVFSVVSVITQPGQDLSK